MLFVMNHYEDKIKGTDGQKIKLLQFVSESEVSVNPLMPRGNKKVTHT